MPYWLIEPMVLWSRWMPFDLATLENGCMMANPGSHKRGPLPHVHVTNVNADGSTDYVGGISEEHYDQQEVASIPM